MNAGAPNNAPYDAIAAIYDDYWGQDFARLAVNAAESHLVPRLERGAAVLDLCCGTGLVAMELDRMGFRVWGVDESEEMLAVARHNAPRVCFERADMATFRGATKFCAVVSFYNSLNHARSVEHLRETIGNVAAQLVNGGYFLFDYAAPDAFEGAWEARERVEMAGRSMSLEYRYDRDSGCAMLLVDKRECVRQRAFEPELIHEALRGGGLTVLDEGSMEGSGPVRGRRLVLARRG
jgi:SAM-dependent methyltransferase